MFHTISELNQSMSTYPPQIMQSNIPIQSPTCKPIQLI